MKKVIRLTESDLARIVKRVIQENEGIPLFIRRREKKISEIMDEIVNDPDNDPMNFSDEFEYADNILNWTIQTMRGVFGDDMVEQEENDIIGHLKEMYGDHLFDIYNSQVEPEDDDLLEANLARIVKRVIQEQVTKGRNNPRWIKLFNVLRNIGSPKVLTFKDFDGNPSQSLNWGTTKTSNADYGLAASDAHESFYLMSDNKQLLSSLFKWWSNKGYKTDVIGGEVMINFDNVDKISSDLQNFFKSFSPVGKMSIQEQGVVQPTNVTPKDVNPVFDPSMLSQVKSQAKTLSGNNLIMMKVLKAMKQLDPEAYHMITKGTDPIARTPAGDVVVGGTLISLIYTLVQELKGE
jgi:hypothetical protein